MSKANLLWVDLEMTGLYPGKDKIIEVGAIATDWQFNEIARYESPVKVSQAFIERRLVGQFWDEHDLSRRNLIRQNSVAGKTAGTVDDELVTFCERYFAKNSDLPQATQRKIIKNQGSIKLAELAPIYLCGNSIHQDQKFIEIEFPKLQRLLHYRQLDVSSWKIVMENTIQPPVIFAKAENHRAMSDIEESIAELRFYLKQMNWNVSKHQTPPVASNNGNTINPKANPFGLKIASQEH